MRLNLDADFLFDPRFAILADESGMTEDEARMAIIRVWFACYGRRSPVISAREVEFSSRSKRFVDALVASDLAEKVPEGLRIRGVKGRIKYLLTVQESGRRGGVKSGKVRADKARRVASSQPSSDPEGSTNPPSPALSPAPDPSPDPSPPPDKKPTQRENPAAAPPANPDHKRFVDWFDQRFAAEYGDRPEWGKKQGAHVRDLLKKHGYEKAVRHAENMFASPPPFLASSVRDLATLVQHFDKFVQPALPAARAGPGPPGRMSTEDWLNVARRLEGGGQ